jgi:hypothetical protein
MIVTFTRSLALFTMLVAGCGGGSAEAPAPATGGGGGGPSAEHLQADCTAMMARQRECRAAFIPELVALRVRLDVPAGIAAQDQSGGREALVAQANTEFDADSTDEAITRTCTEMMAQVPADQGVAMCQQAESCTAEPTCEAFVPCALAMVEARLTAGAATPETAAPETAAP